jgi:hypothetical protein
MLKKNFNDKFNKEFCDNLLTKDKIAENLGRLNKDVYIYYNLSFFMINIIIMEL